MSKVSTNWKTLSQKQLITNKYTNLWADEVLQPDGKMTIYYVRRKDPFSIVIPYHDSRFYLVQQYRYAVDSLSWEFPMGFVEGKDPFETAVTELKEETGITAKDIREIGKYWVGSGTTNQMAYIFLAQHLTFGEAKPEDGEFFEMTDFSLEEIDAMIKKGEILDGQTITAMYYLKEYLH